MLQVIRKAELLPDPDGPLRGVILVPLYGISVVRRILVVEVVVTLAKGDESSNEVVTWRVQVIKWLFTKPVCKGVDTESGLLEEESSEDTSVDESAEPVMPTKTSNNSRQNNGHEGDAFEVVVVLPNYNRVLVKVDYVDPALTLGILLENHPSNMGVKETFAD
jgi:hypothetical protein